MEQWDVDSCIEFMKKINPNFNHPDNWWMLKSMKSTMYEFILKKLSSKSKASILKAIVGPLEKIFKIIFVDSIKHKTISSRNFWLRFVIGHQKQSSYSKSGGNFIVKRYLQGKSSFYRRVAQEAGDQKLDRKL